MSDNGRFSAGDLVRLLAVRHKDDVFVEQCKTGATTSGGVHIMDAWAMRKSWSSPCYDGYEVKVSRGDFLRDSKWQYYLPMCNRLWFVVPPGLVDQREVPDQCGLLVATANGSRLMAKRQAPHRHIDPPINLLAYVLMWRAAIGREATSSESRATRIAGWQRWLAERTVARGLGPAIGQAVREHVAHVEAENARLKAENARLATIRDVAVSLGLDPSRPVYEWKVRDAMRRFTDEVAPTVVGAMRDARDTLDRALRAIDGAGEREQ